MKTSKFSFMIGVFDSGYGGLTVLKEFLRELPEYDYLYLGDNARNPYGNRSVETLIEFADEAVEYLFEKGCTVIIFACNTLSSTALRHVQEKYLRGPGITDRKILGVIQPLAEAAARTTKTDRVGVIGTRSTIMAGGYDGEIRKMNPDIRMVSKACPLLVPLIEENWYHRPEARMILKKYLRPIINSNVDTLILGCTHYQIMQQDFCKIMGKRVTVLASGEIIAKSLKDFLIRHPDIEQKISKKQSRFFATTDDVKTFQALGSVFLGQPISKVEKVNIHK